MPEYQAPLKDMQFVIKHVVGLDQVNTLPGWEELTGARYKDGAVTMPEGFRDAYWQFAKAGWGNIMSPTEFGGQGLPHLVSTPVEEMWGAANLAFKLCPMLTHGAIEAINHVGPDSLKQRFLPKMI